MADGKSDTQKLAESFAERGDPTGWFDEVYRRAEGDINRVVWADLVPNPSLAEWLETTRPSGNRAIVVGCGLGDDVSYLAGEGFEATGFDVSESAIEMCRQRFPEIGGLFHVANLFDLPSPWPGNFDLVFECNTIQALSGRWRGEALNAIAGLVAPGGVALVSCRSRNTGERENEFPLPLDPIEIAGFERAGLTRLSIDSYDDDQQPPVPHFFATYQRPAQ